MRPALMIWKGARTSTTRTPHRSTRSIRPASPR
jgi:hypothetical protein